MAPTMRLVAAMALGGAARCAKLLRQEPVATSAISAEMSPIRKVITLIEEMKVQVEKEANEDMTAYDKYMCWCETNEKEKGAAIEAAQARLDELAAFLEEAAAKEGELKTNIAGLAQDIAEDQDALATATANRQKEEEAFVEAEADMKETRGLLQEAVAVLEKVQLLQKRGGKPDQSRAKAVLLQLKAKIAGHPQFQGVMQKDLFDMLGSIDDFAKGHMSGFLQQRGGLLPWEKTEEQVGAEAKPNELQGAAAGAKSYNARSGGIVGLLAQMQDQFTADLSEAQKQDFMALVAFENLRAAKLGEIAVATEAKERAEADLADLLDKVAKAKEDMEATAAAMAADQEFLANMRTDCKSEDEQYKARTEIRSKEIVALGEALKILTEDSARDLYAKSTLVFLQRGSSSASVAAQDRLVQRVAQRLAAAARKSNNWALASLAVRVRLDAFEKVKEAMDKMSAELAKQQKEEYEKWEFCKKEIDQTEDSIKVETNTKEDLDSKHAQLVNAIAELNRDIEALQAEEHDMMVSLKQAGENRKEENQVFQTSVSDQRATVNILNKALDRLKQFYAPELAQVHAQEPGRAVAPKPTTPKDYAKSAGAGGVIQLISKIIENAESAEKEMEVDEQHSQALYSDFVKSTTATIEADRAAIAEKTAQVASTESTKSETEAAQLANGEELSKLGDLLKAQHVDCDFLLKYFDVRQKSRAEEMDAIADAKAVLSGADFGK